MKSAFSLLFIGIVLSSGIAIADGTQQGPDHSIGPATHSSIYAEIIKVGEDKKSIEVDAPNKANDITLTLGKSAQDQLTAGVILSQGDKVILGVDGNNLVTSISPQKEIRIPGQMRLIFLMGSAILWVALSLMALWLSGKKGFAISALIIGEDNRYSNSKFQIALWFFIVITTYLATVLLRLWEAGGDYLLVNIPQNLLLLSGMSAISFAGAKAITTSKAQSAANAAQNNNAVKQKTKKTDSAEFFKDLLHNDQGQVDFGDFQMLVVTILASGVYLLQIYHFLGHIDYLKAVSLPDVDTTILSAFGLGQGAYLAKKHAGDPGES